VANYIRRELGAGQVKFIVITPGGTLSVPTGAALLFVFVTSKLLPWMPAIVTVAGGGFLFYWLRNRIKRRKVEQGSTFVASPTELVIGEQAIPRASIEEVRWVDFTHRSNAPRTVNAEYQPGDHGNDDVSFQSSLSVTRVGEGLIPLASGMHASTAEQLAHDLGQTLGGVKVSGGNHYDQLKRI